MLEYSGIFSYKFMTDFGDKFEKYFEEKLPRKIYRSSYFILNELLQNVSHYSAKKGTVDNKEYGYGKIQISLNDKEIVFCIQNHISNDSIDRLIEKIEQYNSFSLEELKQLSKERRKLDQEHDSKGGGIGLIEIRRKSKTDILYSLIDKYDIKEIKIKIILRRGESDG